MDYGQTVMLAGAVVGLGAIAGWHGLAPTIELHRALQATTEANPPHPTIVMLGDSHTAIVNWRMLLHCPNIANDGVGGDTSTKIMARLPGVLAQGPRLVVLMAGTNDALQRVDATETSQNIQAIKAALNERGIDVVILAPPPLYGRTIAAAATLAIDFDDSDFLPDRVHLRRSGYAKWRDAIMPIVHRFC